MENVTQAIARDVLAESMLNLDTFGYKIVGHVHDEVIVEAEKNTTAIEEIEAIMATEIPWAEGLPLNAEGFATEYYRK